jgi:hypothetical protein
MSYVKRLKNLNKTLEDAMQCNTHYHEPMGIQIFWHCFRNTKLAKYLK